MSMNILLKIFLAFVALIPASHCAIVTCEGPCILPQIVSCADLIAANSFFGTCCSLTEDENGFCIVTVAATTDYESYCYWEPKSYSCDSSNCPPPSGTQYWPITNEKCPDSGYNHFFR